MVWLLMRVASNALPHEPNGLSLVRLEQSSNGANTRVLHLFGKRVCPPACAATAGATARRRPRVRPSGRRGHGHPGSWGCPLRLHFRALCRTRHLACASLDSLYYLDLVPIHFNLLRAGLEGPANGGSRPLCRQHRALGVTEANRGPAGPRPTLHAVEMSIQKGLALLGSGFGVKHGKAQGRGQGRGSRGHRSTGRGTPWQRWRSPVLHTHTASFLPRGNRHLELALLPPAVRRQERLEGNSPHPSSPSAL
mmetsp:Transcript_1734/g.5116  ORF Transcript_1734/g.5116 Transcript_1734/m.5116 type:complete len:251 (-) Transcript_1734:67-819(-)